MGRPFVFRCPDTGFNVQLWLDDPSPDDEGKKTYVSVDCSACNRLHLVNRANGKLLGEERK